MQNYSSLLGIPVAGRPRDREARFTIESAYLNTDCDSFIQTAFSRN
jgi:hypothetical protein